jgi:hypothetical protein
MHFESEFNLLNLVQNHNADHIAIIYREGNGRSISVNYKDVHI